MGVPPAVLLLDDGELDDVQDMLQQMEIPFARIRGGAIVDGCPSPRDLLIATPRRIEAVREAVGDAVVPPVRVMVVSEDSNALRSRLRRSGFDYLVRRPVHADALRLMLLHCVYKGQERRSEPRVAVGFEVALRSGLTTRRATLVDLSLHGCRLLTRQRVEKGKRIKIEIPEALQAGEPTAVTGRVARVEENTRDVGPSFVLGVSFEKGEEQTQEALELLIEDHARGPATLRSGADDLRRPPAPEREPARPRSAERAAVPGSGASERRGHKRVAYSRMLQAFNDRALRVLVGRDLSVGGMRIQAQPDLEVGDRLHLAIYGEAGEDPLLVWGCVVRSDADHGLAIRFDPVGGEAEARLERLVASLPAVESLHDSEAEAMGTVLSEIVE